MCACRPSQQTRGEVQPSNELNISTAERAIEAAFASEVASGVAVLAVGDWNGPTHRVPLHGGAASWAKTARVSPATPTQYGMACAVDWAVLIENAADTTPSSSVQCEALGHPAWPLLAMQLVGFDALLCSVAAAHVGAEAQDAATDLV